MDQTLTWGALVGPAKVAPGFMTTPTSTDTGEQTPAKVCAIWDDLSVRGPARGVMTWSVNLDRKNNYTFARECASEILDG